jgi:hypothetical protein
MKDKPGIFKLIISLAVDATGMITYLIPGIGETADAIWAPISGIIIGMMYGGIPGIIGFIEELGPGTDIIPTATITWIYKKIKKDETV